MAILRHPLPPGICTRQTSSLRGLARARDPAPRQFFDQTSMMQNDHRRIQHHRRARAEANFDNMNFPPPVKMRGNMEGHGVEGRGNLFQACYNDSTFQKVIAELRFL